MKTVEINIRLWVIVLIAAILMGAVWALFKIKDARHQNEVDSVNMELYQAQTTISEYEIQVSGLKERVSEIGLIVISRDKDIFRLKEEGERLRKLNIKKVNLIGELQARIDVLAQGIEPEPVGNTGIVDFIDGTPAKPTLKLPAKYGFEDQWVSTSTTIGTNGKADIKFNMSPIPINLVVGEQSQGFLKKREDVFAVTTPSPYITFDESKMVLVDNSPPNWPWFALGAGTTAGIVILVKFLVK